MAVKIRLSRIGKKNRPYWRVVAVDSRKKRDGEFLENLGTYDPIDHQLVQFHYDRIIDWISKGAIPSETVVKLMKQHLRAA
jgi:small subunit ribosomal protein S16